MSINTRVRTTSQTVMCDTEVQYQRYRTPRIRNRPVVSLFGTRVSGTGASMITESINIKLFSTTNRERKLRQDCYCCTDTRDKECLSETSRPDLTSVMSPDRDHALLHTLTQLFLTTQDRKGLFEILKVLSQSEDLVCQPILSRDGDNIGSVHSPHN